ncbi:type II toxin-antitoxin system RelE/ParE family toxin [Marinobacterium litorale]|uniref:type II toxin-antitoxin system RelE/ParE family toxin n=1 Tax=Marinobacterium litorale TaxID=404770 RepID=UPI0003FD0324|nr:type II toxin-antitoxin system RelE/ParE family toxin [Marinobacterium litorale]
MIKTTRDRWLDDYYFQGKTSSNIPKEIDGALKRKLDIIHAAHGEQDLRVPPGNRFEHLSGNLKDWWSIRVNKQYRLIFKWREGEALELYLDAHTYR